MPSELSKISEATIIKAINGQFSGNCKYKIANCYVFKHDWESDFFVLKQNGYCYEFEIKISRSDFFADKKKTKKHLILSTGRYLSKHHTYNHNHTSEHDKWITEEVEKNHDIRPNKFYYVVPRNMISKEEVPEYAGLIYYSSSLDKVKEAPFIHKQKLELEKNLCPKFYNKWIDAKNEIHSLSCTIEGLRYERDALKEKIKLLETAQIANNLSDHPDDKIGN